MVARTYTPPQFNVQDTRTVSQAGVAESDNRVMTPNLVGDSGWRDKAIAQLAGSGVRPLEDMADIEFSNLYLEGQAQAGIAQSEDELQGNPLTRDWKVAGYRDTMGKLALADADAQFQVDIKRLREANPEDMQTYLADRRGKLMPGLSGMSREARATAAGQLLLSDRAAIKTYTSEHTKFIIETTSQGYTSQWNVARNNLRRTQLLAANGDISQDDFNEQMRSAAGTIVGSVWQDKRLPMDVKQGLTEQMLSSTLADDIVPLYDYLQNNKVPDGKGGSSTIISRLPGDSQLKLANAYRESMARTNDMRAIARMEQIADLESQLSAAKDGKTGVQITSTWDDIKGMLDPMVLNRTISGERAGAIKKSYLEYQLKNEARGDLSSAYFDGRIDSIIRTGKTAKEAADAADEVMTARNYTPAQRLSAHLSAGLNGLNEGFKKAGEQLGPSIRQLINSDDGTVNPEHLQKLEKTFATLKQAERNGLTTSRVALLSGLPDDDRATMERILTLRDKTGMSFDQAVKEVQQITAREQAVPASTRSAMSQSTQQEIGKQIDAIEPRGIMGTIWGNVKSVFSANAEPDLKLRPQSYMNSRDGWFKDSATVQWYTQNTREELRTTSAKYSLTHPGASASEIMNMTKADVAARTIETRHGPLIMPDGADVASIYGVAPGNQAGLGRAIDAMLPNTKDNTRYKLVFAQGSLFAQEVGKNGEHIGNGVLIAPEALRAEVERQTNAETVRADEIHGDGRAVSADGVSFRYNGSNSAGVPNAWVFGLRSNLIKHELVRSTPYPDASGKLMPNGERVMTAGVGVSSHNPAYPKVGPDGKVSGIEVQRSFLSASNAAAYAGAREAKAAGRYNAAGFQLMSEIAYQAGPNFMSRKDSLGEEYRALQLAMRRRDPAAAVEALKKTSVWRYSADRNNPDTNTARQNGYLKLLNESFR